MIKIATGNWVEASLVISVSSYRADKDGKSKPSVVVRVSPGEPMVWEFETAEEANTFGDRVGQTIADALKDERHE